MKESILDIASPDPKTFGTGVCQLFLLPSHHLKMKCICRITSEYVLFQKHSPSLSYDELMTVRKILQRSNIDVDNEYIRETWHPVYRRHFLKQSLARAYDCRKGYYLYHQGVESEVRQACLIHNRIKIR